MSPGTKLMEQLRLLVHDGTEAVHLHQLDTKNGTMQLVVYDADHSVRLELCDYDRYSVTLYTLEVGQQRPGVALETVSVSAYAAQISRRLSYLEEPLAVYELDRSMQVAQLRSLPPQREGAEVFYWEVMVWANADRRATITRYHWAPGMVEREVVAYPATFALVTRITDSIYAALTTTMDD